MGVTQATPSVLLHVSGKPVSVVEPLYSGPPVAPVFGAGFEGRSERGGCQQGGGAVAENVFPQSFHCDSSHTTLTAAKQGGFIPRLMWLARAPTTAREARALPKTGNRGQPD